MHCVNSDGCLLLSQFEYLHQRNKIQEIEIDENVGDYLLLAMGCQAVKQEEAILFAMRHFSCHTEEEGEAVGRLINRSREWGASVELLGDVGSSTWTLLAEAMKKGGYFESIVTSKEVIMRGNEEDHLIIGG